MSNRSDELLTLLRYSDAERDVYEAGTRDGKHGRGEYYLTYSAALRYRPFRFEDIEPLLARGVLVPKWDDAPHLHYYKIGKLP